MGHRSRSQSKGKEVATEKGQNAGRPQIQYAQHPLRSFSLDMRPDKLAQSQEDLIEGVLVMLNEAVEDEMRRLPKKDRKPVTVHGKQYTPLKGSFLVELVHPGKVTVTLLFGMDNLYVQGMHVIDLWFLTKDCTAPLPPKSQKKHGPKTVNAGTESEFKFNCGIYIFKWTGSYLDLEAGKMQMFFSGAAEDAHSLPCGAQEAVVDKSDKKLQPGVAFFALFIPECIRFPHVKGWVRCHTAPGANKPVTLPNELQILMGNWGVKSDLLYSEETPFEIRRTVRIMKRNLERHSQLRPETLYEQGSTSRLHSKNILEPKVNDYLEHKKGPINEGDIADEEEGLDDSCYLFYGHAGDVVSVACSPLEESLVLTGGSDGGAFLWKIGCDEFVHKLDGHLDTVCTVAFSSDGALTACGSMEGKVSVWDTGTAALEGIFEGSGRSFKWLKWHPHGHLIIAGSEDHDVYLWNADLFCSMLKFVGHTSTVTCGDFTPDGKLICTGSSDASLIIWHPKTAEVRNLIQGTNYHAEGLTCLSISLDSRFVVSCSRDGSVFIVDVDSGQHLSFV